MTRWTLLGAAVVAALLAAASADPAVAASAVTFVSGLGTDSGACTRAAPCRNFQFALDQTAAGGLVAALDGAGYGSMRITKSVTIAGPGNGRAAISPKSGFNPVGIYIEAPGATVVLRGLEIDGGYNGIGVGQAASVVISDSVIVSSSNLAIYVADSAASVLVQDTTVRSAGVDTNAASFAAKRMTISGSPGSGFRVLGGHAVLDNCTVSGSGLFNVTLVGGTTIIKRSVLAAAGLRGIDAGPGTTTYFDTTTTFGSGQFGIVSGSATFSYGNNNFPDETNGTITPIAGD